MATCIWSPNKRILLWALWQCPRLLGVALVWSCVTPGVTCASPLPIHLFIILRACAHQRLMQREADARTVLFPCPHWLSISSMDYKIPGLPSQSTWWAGPVFCFYIVQGQPDGEKGKAWTVALMKCSFSLVPLCGSRNSKSIEMLTLPFLKLQRPLAAVATDILITIHEQDKKSMSNCQPHCVQ